MEELKVVCMRKAKIKDTEAHQGETTTSVTLNKTHRLKICTLGSESSSCKDEWISRDLIGQCFCLYWSLILNITGPGAEQVCRIGYHGDVPWIKPEVASISPKHWAHTDLCSDISVHSADDTDQSGLSRLWLQVNCAEQSYCFGFKLELQWLADGNRTCKLFSVIRRADGFLETNPVRGECV